MPDELPTRTIAIDMDEVIADSMSRILAKYNAEFNADLTIARFAGINFRDAVPAEHRSRTNEYPNEPEFFKHLPVIENSQRVLKRLMKRYNIFITTAAMKYPTSFTDKYEWMKKHFPFIPCNNIVFCGDKSIIAADYLIDDNASHFAQFKGAGILFTAPHNINEQRYQRVNNWLEVEALFLR